MRRALQAGAIAGLLAAAFAAVQTPGAAALAWLSLTGRSPDCPWKNALGASVHARLLEETKDRIVARLQRSAEADGGLELWETPRGSVWIPAGNQFLMAFNLAEQELDIYEAGEVRVRPGDIVLDCGANVGLFARKALARGARLVVAIEPAPRNLECLRRNLAHEVEAGRVIVYPKGVWDREDVLTLHIDPANTAAASFVTGSNGGQNVTHVPLTTIDRLVAELNLPRVDYIKMDIEGAETRALHGAAETLKRWRPRLAISAYHLPEDPRTIPAAVRAALAGYRMRCGACERVDGRIRPKVLLFW